MIYIRLNPNTDHVLKIVKAINKKDGFCPCKVGKKPENKCPCDEFINTSKCHCKLFVEE